jgi:hypothetical protein
MTAQTFLGCLSQIDGPTFEAIHHNLILSGYMPYHTAEDTPNKDVSSIALPIFQKMDETNWCKVREYLHTR